MFRQPALLVNYLNNLQWWLRQWSIAINVTKITAALFAKPGRRIPAPRPVQLFRELMHFVNAVHYLGATLDTLLNWSTHQSGEKESAT
jgi:hypothetical protein